MVYICLGIYIVQIVSPQITDPENLDPLGMVSRGIFSSLKRFEGGQGPLDVWLPRLKHIVYIRKELCFIPSYCTHIQKGENEIW